MGSAPLYKGYKATRRLFEGSRASEQSTHGVYYPLHGLCSNALNF